VEYERLALGCIGKWLGFWKCIVVLHYILTHLEMKPYVIGKYRFVENASKAHHDKGKYQNFSFVE